MSDQRLMPIEDINDLDDVVRELDIESSDVTPAEAVIALRLEIERLRAENAETEQQIEKLNEKAVELLRVREQLVKRNAALCNIRDTLLCPQDDSAAISQAYAVAVRTLALSDEKRDV